MKTTKERMRMQSNFKRLAKDYEYKISSSTAMIQLAFISLMLNKKNRNKI
jgi:hypothetical protein